MKRHFQSSVLLACLILSSFAKAADCDSPCQLTQVKSYFSALDIIGRAGSTEKDIDALLSLVHDDVKYIHVEYLADFNKTTWRKAFVRNLKRGAYQNDTSNQIRVLNKIYGKNHLAIEYSHGVLQADGSWQPSEPQLVLFGFKEGKISLVKELW